MGWITWQQIWLWSQVSGASDASDPAFRVPTSSLRNRCFACADCRWQQMAVADHREPALGCCSRCRSHVCQKCTGRGAPLPGEGARPNQIIPERGGRVFMFGGCSRLASILLFCHHTFYFCASVVCAAAFVSLLLPRFFHFIFNFLLLLCSLGILLHCLILSLGGISQLIIKWKCVNSPGLPFGVRRSLTWEELGTGSGYRGSI